MRRFARVVFVALLISTTAVQAQRTAADDRDALLQNIEARRTTYADVAKQIWSFAEVGYQEEKSSALLQQQLKAAGLHRDRTRRRDSDGVRRHVRIGQAGDRHRR